MTPSETLRLKAQEIRVQSHKIELAKSPSALVMAISDTASLLIELNVLAMRWEAERNKVYESKIHEGGSL